MTIKLVTSHSTIEGTLVSDKGTQYILSDVTITRNSEVVTHKGYTVPKSMVWYTV